jgi:hypothetical protein
LASLINHSKDLTDAAFGAWVESELGLPATWSHSTTWYQLLEKWALRDVLDVVTLTFRFLNAKRQRGGGGTSPVFWINNINRIFTEENVHYPVDDAGGVHFRFDQEFAQNSAASIAALTGPRYDNARDAFQQAMASLSNAPPDGKGAIRYLFSSAECVFKLILPKVPRLGAAELSQLSPLLDKVFAENATARRAAAKLLGSFKEWTDAAHFYRHEEGAEEVAQPPLTVAVYLVSTGAAHLRWLAEIDASPNAKP